VIPIGWALIDYLIASGLQAPHDDENLTAELSSSYAVLSPIAK
jgi:hypothetical protein